jgi:hypothetical protein
VFSPLVVGLGQLFGRCPGGVGADTRHKQQFVFFCAPDAVGEVLQVSSKAVSGRSLSGTPKTM